MFARTDRLLLRPGWPEDAPALSRAIASEAVVLSLAELPWPHALGDVEAYLGRERRIDECDLLIFARTMGAPRLIGGVGLARTDRDVELGYWIVPSHWGLGFATEAGRAVVAMARDSLRLGRLVAREKANNTASGNVLCKLGFVPRGGRYELELMPMALAA